MTDDFVAFFLSSNGLPLCESCAQIFEATPVGCYGPIPTCSQCDQPVQENTNED